MDRSKIWTKSFIALCLSSFFVYLNVYMLSTALPLYVGGGLAGNQQQMGLTITLWSVGVVLFRVFSGRWIDRYGTRNLSIAAVGLFLIFSMMYFGAAAFLPLLAVRVLHGGSFAVAATATSAYAIGMIPVTRKGEGIGYFSMFMSLAMVLGPALGIYLWDAYRDEAAIFTLTALISGLAFLCLLFIGRPRRTAACRSHTKRGAAAGGQRSRDKLAWRSLIEPKALPISLAGFMLAISYSSLTSFIPSFTKEIGQGEAAAPFFIVFAVMIIVARLFAGKAFDRYGEHCIVYPGIISFGLGMFMLSLEHSVAVLLVSAGLLGLGHGALFPCFQTLAVKSASDARMGVATATFFLLFDIGFGLGSFLLGWIAEDADYRSMFFAACLASCLCAVVYYVMHHRPWLNKTLASS